MKINFFTILILLSLAVIGVYVSCTGTQTDATAGKRIKKTAFSQIDSVLLVASNDETAAMGCPCRKPGNIEKCKSGKGDCAPWSSWDEYTYCVSLLLENEKSGPGSSSIAIPIPIVIATETWYR
ncbi:hypothetical protein [uncultured Desulfobacter sp.]|uniref:hypothetical protein n=1 Tax=uncultured Desulfobacter sp. TaxID=240139 RepID=UPI002AAB6CB8|nr:hypothetical protein [uncultured Desulfobacter sp.]